MDTWEWEEDQDTDRDKVRNHIDGGFYFVCDHEKHRNAKRYNYGCNLLLGGGDR